MSLCLLIYFYLAALLPLVLFPLFFSSNLICTLPALLFYILYKRGYKQALLLAFFAGLLLDLISSKTPFGFWPLNYTLSLFILVRLKQLFFIEKLTTLPLLSLFFSWTSTLIYFMLYYTFCSKTHLSVKWVMTDLVILPVGDSLYALVFFSLPYYFLSKFFKVATRSVASLNLKKTSL